MGIGSGNRHLIPFLPYYYWINVKKAEMKYSYVWINVKKAEMK